MLHAIDIIPEIDVGVNVGHTERTGLFAGGHYGDRRRVVAADGNRDNVLLKQRHDELPKLVETCKQYMQFEQDTLEKVMQARSAVFAAREKIDVNALGPAETQLRAGLMNLFAVAEAYPELRASENFRVLQGELSSIEDAIQNARRYYNAIVRDLNTACDAFPSNLVAGMFSITKGEYFEIEEREARQVPQVDFSS